MSDNDELIGDGLPSLETSDATARTHNTVDISPEDIVPSGCTTQLICCVAVLAVLIGVSVCLLFLFLFNDQMLAPEKRANPGKLSKSSALDNANRNPSTAVTVVDISQLFDPNVTVVLVGDGMKRLRNISASIFYNLAPRETSDVVIVVQKNVATANSSHVIS